MTRCCLELTGCPQDLSISGIAYEDTPGSVTKSVKVSRFSS